MKHMQHIHEAKKVFSLKIGKITVKMRKILHEVKGVIW